MEIELQSTEGLPEGIAKLVTEADGKSTLDLSKLMPVEDLTSLKGALSKERDNNAAWGKLGESPDAVLAQINDLKNAKPKGKTDDDVAAMIEQATKPLQAKLDASTKQLGDLRSKSTSQQISVELAKAGVLPEALDMVANFATSRIMYAEDGSLQIRTSDGKPMVGSGENHTATISDLVTDIVGNMPFAVKDGGKGGGGKPPENGGKPPAKSILRSEFDSLSPQGKMDHIRGGGTVTD
jgi:hypothetical protein